MSKDIAIKMFCMAEMEKTEREIVLASDLGIISCIRGLVATRSSSSRLIFEGLDRF